jgi:hypothetical protein
VVLVSLSAITALQGASDPDTNVPILPIHLNLSTGWRDK